MQVKGFYFLKFVSWTPCVSGVTYKLVNAIGVPATSQILTGDSQKLSFSTLTKVPFLIF